MLTDAENTAPPLGNQPGATAPVPLAAQVGAALCELLTPLVPLLPPEQEGQEEGRPWAPFLLYGAAEDPHAGYRLRRGPAPLDEPRLVAGLQARPLGLGPGPRTGEAPILASLGPTWRGHLLALLRALHGELDDWRTSLSLHSLGQLLLLCGPPIPPDKLVRLSLGLPVDFLQEETATLLRRVQRLEGQPPRAVPRCSDQAVGRLWADALRSLSTVPDQEKFLTHCEQCPRCATVAAAFRPLLATIGPQFLMSADAPEPAADDRRTPLFAEHAPPAAAAPPAEDPIVAAAPAAAPAAALLRAEAPPAPARPAPVAAPPPAASARRAVTSRQWTWLGLGLALTLLLGLALGFLLARF